MNLPGVLMAIGIGAAIIIGVIGMANTAIEKNKSSDLLTLVAQLRQGTTQAFAGTPQYGAAAADLVPALDVRGVIPDSARVVVAAGTQIWHPFGAQITIVVDAVVTQFDMTLLAMPQGACTRLGDAFVGQTTQRSGLVSITVNAVALAAPVTAAHFTTNCAAAGAAMILTFV